MASEPEIRDALRHVVDPEIGVNIVDLGLVYCIEIDGARVRIAMTMTSPVCPLAHYVKDRVASAIRQRVPAVADVDIVVVWDPPWASDMMSEAARRQLGLGGR